MLHNTHALRISGVGKILHKKKILENISLSIETGEIFACIGPSGSGKSTLLRIMSGLITPDHGEVILGDGFTKKDIGFVFQQFALLPWLNVLQNIELGLLARGASNHECKIKTGQEMRLLNLEKYAHMYPKDLSSGMRQRVGIARALITDPKIIFMDEPFSELDPFIAHSLAQDILSIWQERKLTIVMVTNTIPEAIEFADRIAVLTPQPGKIEKIVSNKLSRPRNKRSEHFWHLEDELYNILRQK